ncbi:MAG: heparinase II/III family protein [Firmicutes bacterium]|nr:heparinase II/III family protein [Candidatus Colimorpha enterica]
MDYDMNRIGEQIVELVKKKHPGCGHPRIIFTADRFDYLKGQYGKDNVYGKEIDHVVKFADRFLDAPVSTYVIPDGIRLLQTSRNVLDRVNSLAIAYRVTGEKKYLDRCIKEMDAVAEFPDWHPYHFLDTAELCNAFACGYDWLYDEIDEERRAKYRKVIVEFGFLPAMDDYLDKPRKRTYNWYYDYPGDNWKLVCNGGESMAALAICDEDDSGLCPQVLTYAYKNSHEFVRNAYVALDGSYVESMTYWAYATQYLARYATSLVTACGTDFDLTDTEGMRKTGYFLPLLADNKFVAFNFGDAGESTMFDPALLWVGHEMGQPEVSYIRYKYIEKGLYSMLDLFWLYPEDNYDSSLTLPTNYGEIGATNATFRTGWGEQDMYVGVHYGKNRVPHGHNDMGTFILQYKGERIFYDLGSDNYNLTHYGNCYRHRGEGHNTLIFNPKPDVADLSMKGESYISKYKATDDECFAVCDMTSSYDMKSVVRGVKMVKSEKAVTIHDEVTTNEKTDWAFWFAHTHAAILIEEDGKTAHLTQNGVKIKALCLGDGTFGIMDAKSFYWSEPIEGQAENKNARKLTICLSGKTEYVLDVVFFPEESDYKPENKPISDWQ